MNIPEDARIKKATYVADYTIRFTFTDGHVSEIDFYPFLSAAGQNPMNSQYLDVLRFRQFKLHRNVDVYWDDWEMCFRFETLYAGKLPKMPKPRVRAVRHRKVARKATSKA
jgi:hypothetical protein